MTDPDEEDSFAAQLHSEAKRLLASMRSPKRLLGDLPEGLDDAWERVAEAGWLRTIVPEDDDGLGLGLVELGSVFRAVGHAPVRGPLLDQAVTVPLVIAAGGAGVREKLLPTLDGDGVAVLVEDLAPPYGRGVDGVTIADGRLNGRASLVPFAPVATHFLVVANAPSGLTIARVDASDANVLAVESADPSVIYGDVVFDDVAVAPADVIATGTDAAALRDRIRGALRLMAAAELSGAADELTDLAVDYAKVRVQFGRPIAGFQAIRHILADMTGRCAALHSLVDARLVDADGGADWAVLGRLVKAYSTEPARFVAEQSLQVHGGIGFTWETTPHLHLRRALTLAGYLGETSDLLLDIGERELT